MTVLKQVADAKLRDAPGVARKFFSFETLRTQFHKTMDNYRKKYIETDSPLPFWHVVYGGTLFSYICVWPTEYAHYKHKEEARLKGEKH